MLIHDLPVYKIVIYDKETQEAIVEIDDKECKAIDKVGIYFDVESSIPSNEWLVKKDDILYLIDHPSIAFVVMNANKKYFKIAKLELEEDNSVRIDADYMLTYCNNGMICSLKDLGFALVPKEEGQK